MSGISPEPGPAKTQFKTHLVGLWATTPKEMRKMQNVKNYVENAENAKKAENAETKENAENAENVKNPAFSAFFRRGFLRLPLFFYIFLVFRKGHLGFLHFLHNSRTDDHGCFGEFSCSACLCIT